MEIAIVKEIAAHGRETRPILLPREVKRQADEGHHIFVEKGLGAIIFYSVCCMLNKILSMCAC